MDDVVPALVVSVTALLHVDSAPVAGLANAVAAGRSFDGRSPCRYRLNSCLDRSASNRRTSRRLPLT